MRIKADSCFYNYKIGIKYPKNNAEYWISSVSVCCPPVFSLFSFFCEVNCANKYYLFVDLFRFPFVFFCVGSMFCVEPFNLTVFLSWQSTIASSVVLFAYPHPANLSAVSKTPKKNTFFLSHLCGNLAPPNLCNVYSFYGDINLFALSNRN